MTYELFEPGTTEEQIKKVLELKEKEQKERDEALKKKYPELFMVARNFVETYKKEIVVNRRI